MESNQIINNLLNYARIKMPDYQRVRIDHLLRECVIFAKKRFHKRSVSVVVHIEGVKGKFMDADPVHLREVFNNILNNAYQAIQHNRGRIEVRAYFDNQGFIRISFKDNGAGIEEGNLQRIFEPFYTTKSKGTGLGLTISKDLVELSGGRIYIETQKNRGTAITIRLPVKKKTS